MNFTTYAILGHFLNIYNYLYISLYIKRIQKINYDFIKCQNTINLIR